MYVALKVMSGQEWCTLEDWLQCRDPLCGVLVRHDEQFGGSGSASGGVQVCFASPRLGSNVLDCGVSQVSLCMRVYHFCLLNLRCQI